MRYKEFDFEKSRLKYCLLSEICKISTTKDNRQYAHAWDYCTLTKGIIYLMAWAIVCCLVVGIAEPQIRQHSIVPTLLPFILTAYFWETVGKTLYGMQENVFHYTSYQALLGIIQKNEIIFHGSRHDCMNDPND